MGTGHDYGVPSILRSDRAHILLKGVPPGLAPTEICDALGGVPAWRSSLHVRRLINAFSSLSVHVLLASDGGGGTARLAMNDVPKARFGIKDATVRIEQASGHGDSSMPEADFSISRREEPSR